MMITWHDLVAFTPSADEIARFAAPLAAAYNEPRNAALLGNTQAMSPADVIEHYGGLRPPRAYPFVLLRAGELAGDGDLRGIAGGAGELAFLIAAPSAQGQGLGTRFATMLTAFAFRRLALAHVYASVLPANAASLRVFAKLGYAETDDAAFGDPGDVVLRIDRAGFERTHAAVLAEIEIAPR